MASRSPDDDSKFDETGTTKADDRDYCDRTTCDRVSAMRTALVRTRRQAASSLFGILADTFNDATPRSRPTVYRRSVDKAYYVDDEEAPRRPSRGQVAVDRAIDKATETFDSVADTLSDRRAELDPAPGTSRASERTPST